jgi:molybdopterin converting factor small subunit
MITVKLYGLLRIESGIKEKQLDARTVKEALDTLALCGIPKKDLDSCIILVNGRNASKRSKLTDGDSVVLMSPVAGG